MTTRELTWETVTADEIRAGVLAKGYRLGYNEYLFVRDGQCYACAVGGLAVSCGMEPVRQSDGSWTYLEGNAVDYLEELGFPGAFLEGLSDGFERRCRELKSKDPSVFHNYEGHFTGESREQYRRGYSVGLLVPTGDEVEVPE